jgi:hypothetical protein
MSEQKEALRKAEASLHDAEKRLALVRKWQPAFKHAVLEYHASVQRIKDLAAGDVPSAVNLLTRIVDALEAYLRVAPPSGSVSDAAVASDRAPAPAPLVAIARTVLDESAAAEAAEAEAKLHAEAQARAAAEVPVAVAVDAAVAEPAGDEPGSDTLAPD